MTVVDEQEIARYVEQVRAALADLPPAVRDELTEDLAEHLTEVAAEADGSLTDRLGSPGAYAAELRSAAGAGVPRGGPNLDQRIAATVVRARARLRVVDARLGPPLGYASASEYLRLLRPAWWLLRGYLAAMLVTVILTGGSIGLLPRLGGSTLAALLLLGVCVAASVWLGRRTPGLRRGARLTLWAGTAALVLFAVVGFVEADQDVVDGRYDYAPTSAEYGHYNVRDVYVYDSEGRLVENARLFDQDGNPIRLGYPECPDLRETVEFAEPVAKPVVPLYPYCPDQAPFRFGPTPEPPAPPVAPVMPTPPATATAPAQPSAPGEPTPTPSATTTR